MRSYLDLLRHVRDNGEEHDDRTGVGTLSVFGYQWRHNLADGFPLLTTKKLPLRWIAEELFWFISGSGNERDLQAKGVDIWREWATEEQCARFGRKEGDLGHVYGPLWRDFHRVYTCGNIGGIPAGRVDPESRVGGPLFGNDQIFALLHDIENNPNSRRLIVTGWHPIEQRKVALPPCHSLYQLRCHADGRLSLHLYARSIDSFLGLPFNIASYAILTHLLAHVTGRTPGELIISFGDLHIYKNHLAQVEEQLSREPRDLPTLILHEDIAGRGFDGLTSATWDQCKLHRYNPHPKITAEVAV